MDNNPLRWNNNNPDLSDSDNTGASSSRINTTLGGGGMINPNVSSLLAYSDELRNLELQQQRQLLLQQQLSREGMTRQDEIRALLGAQSPQRSIPTRLDNMYGVSSLQSTTGTSVGGGREYIPNNDVTFASNDRGQDTNLSTLLRNIERRKYEQNQTLRRLQHRELISSAAADLTHHTQQHRSNTSDRMGALDGVSGLLLNNTVPSQYAAAAAASQFPSNFSIQNLQHLQERAFGGSTTMDGNRLQETILEDYLRSQQHPSQSMLSEMEAKYQHELYSDFNTSQDRLALLLLQRQQLEQQSLAPMITASTGDSRNIFLDNSNPAETKIASGKVSKINKLDTLLQKPKRPLSAYNIFFQQERQKLLGGDDAVKEDTTDASDDKHKDNDDEKKPAANPIGAEPLKSTKRKRGKPHHKVTFEAMAKIIGQKWKDLEADKERKKFYQDLAQNDKERYQKEIATWKKQRNAALTEQRKNLEATVDDNIKERYMEHAKLPRGNR